MTRQAAMTKPTVHPGLCAVDNASASPTRARVPARTPAALADAARSAGLLAAAADPVRWTLLQLLAERESCVCELQANIPIAPNLLSYHLKTLRDAGLVVGSRRGRWIDYRLADGALARLHAALPTPATRTVPGDGMPDETATAARCTR